MDANLDSQMMDQRIQDGWDIKDQGSMQQRKKKQTVIRNPCQHTYSPQRPRFDTSPNTHRLSITGSSRCRHLEERKMTDPSKLTSSFCYLTFLKQIMLTCKIINHNDLNTSCQQINHLPRPSTPTQFPW